MAGGGRPTVSEALRQIARRQLAATVRQQNDDMAPYLVRQRREGRFDVFKPGRDVLADDADRAPTEGGQGDGKRSADGTARTSRHLGALVLRVQTPRATQSTRQRRLPVSTSQGAPPQQGGGDRSNITRIPRRRTILADSGVEPSRHPSTVNRHLADLRARSGLTTEQPIYTGRAEGWLVVPSLEPS